jgi:hypothetical protein
MITKVMNPINIMIHAVARIARSLSTGYGAGFPLICSHGIVVQKAMLFVEKKVNIIFHT